MELTVGVFGKFRE